VWNDLKRAARIPGSRRQLLGEALLALLIARGVMLFLPFRRIAEWLGTPGAESPVAAAPDEIRMAQEVGWAVGVIARQVPWDGRCLAQALAATGMLRRRGMEGTVSFGVCEGQGKSAGFDAHAWLRFGSCVVTGGPEHQRYKVITTFARKRP